MLFLPPWLNYNLAIVFGIVGAVVYLVLAEGVGLSGGNAGIITQQVATLLLVPLGAAVGTVLYLDLRVRKEDLGTAELATLLSRGA